MGSSILSVAITSNQTSAGSVDLSRGFDVFQHVAGQMFSADLGVAEKWRHLGKVADQMIAHVQVALDVAEHLVTV